MRLFSLGFGLAGLLAVGLACLPHAHANPPPDPLLRLKADMPAPVARLMDRMVECQHWAGEEPYDRQRRAEISRAVKRLRCDQLEQDESRITKQHADNPLVKQRLDAIRDGDW